MGLDGVEMVMAVEDYFGVELENEQCANATTPRQLGDLIFSKLQATDETYCQSQRAFYLLRRAFVKQFGLRRDELRPDMPFRHLIPKGREKECWQRLRDELSARAWPQLVRPAWMVMAFLVLCLAICAVWVGLVVHYVANTTHWMLSVGAIFLAAPLVVIGCFVLFFRAGGLVESCTAGYATHIPARLKLLRDLVPYAINAENMAWTRAQVSEQVKRIVMEQLGVSESRYTEDSRFYEDLGMD